MTPNEVAAYVRNQYGNLLTPQELKTRISFYLGPNGSGPRVFRINRACQIKVPMHAVAPSEDGSARADKLIAFRHGRPQELRKIVDDALHALGVETKSPPADALNESVRPFAPTATSELAKVLEEVSGLPEFDPDTVEAALRRVTVALVQRQGQGAFRKAVLRNYDHACCLSGCALETVLDAAHISPYCGRVTQDVTNGLALRTDLHTLFDRGLIRLAADGCAAEVHPSISDDPIVRDLTYRPGRVKPSLKAIAHHRELHWSTWS